MRQAPVLIAAAVSAAALALTPIPARSQAPGPNYELKPVEGGFLRLDRNSGATAFCQPAGEGYACRPAAEDGGAGPSVVDLEKRVAELERRVKELGGDPASPKATKRDPTLDLPSDEQVDRLATFLERAMKRFRQLATDMQKESGSL